MTSKQPSPNHLEQATLYSLYRFPLHTWRAGMQLSESRGEWKRHPVLWHAMALYYPALRAS